MRKAILLWMYNKIHYMLYKKTVEESVIEKCFDGYVGNTCSFLFTGGFSYSYFVEKITRLPRSDVLLFCCWDFEGSKTKRIIPHTAFTYVEVSSVDKQRLS